MALRVSPHLEEFFSSLDDWTDHRFITREELKDVSMFMVHIVNLAEEDGWQYTGHSLKTEGIMSRLVVRGTIDGAPHVVFSSGRTTMGCIRAFMRKMDEGWLEWVVDRYG